MIDFIMQEKRIQYNRKHTTQIQNIKDCTIYLEIGKGITQNIQKRIAKLGHILRKKRQYYKNDTHDDVIQKLEYR